MPAHLIRTYEHAHEASLDYARLRDAGVPCFIKNDIMVNTAPLYSNAVGGVQLYVHENYIEEAAELLSFQVNEENLVDEAQGIEHGEDVATCPECGSPNIVSGRSFWSGVFFLILSGLPVSIRNKKMHCADCDHKWKDF